MMAGAAALKSLQKKRYDQWKRCFLRSNGSDVDKSMWESIRPHTIWELPADDEVRKEHPELVPLLESMDHRPGDVLLAAVGKGDARVYSLRHDHETTDFQVHRDTLNAWFDALAAVPRSLQYFVRLDNWAMLSNFPSVRSVSGSGRGNDSRHPLVPVALDGPSFGLAFALSIASCLVDKPLPTDIIALAGCDPFGKLLPVDGLTEKLEAIRLHAPRITRVIVADDQVIPDERPGLLEHCRPFRASRLQSAFAIVFPDNALNERLRNWIREDRPEEVADQLLHYVLLERQRPNSLKPISDTAELVSEHARAQGVTLSSAHEETLKFTRAVALRRDGDEPMAVSQLPRAIGWADELPSWMRLLVLAEYCQQTYDTGSPSLDDVETLFEQVTNEIGVSLDPKHASFEELRLLSAWWRVAELRGRFREACEMQRLLAEQWVKRRLYAEATRPLARALCLAGALRDKDMIEELNALAGSTMTYLDSDDIGRVYIRLAQFRAAVCLDDRDEAERLRRQLEHTERLPQHIRFCADRFTILMPKYAASTRILSRLQNARDEEKEYCVLVELELAMRSDPDSADVIGYRKELSRDSKQFEMLYAAVANNEAQESAVEAELIRRALDFYPY